MALSSKNKTKTAVSNTKRRSALHHRRSNKSYLKSYWPYLPMLIIVICGFSVNQYLTARSGVLGASLDYSRSTFLADTNSFRNANHESSLSLNSELDYAAQAKAQDMVSKNYWSHNSPSGQTPWNFINNAGYQFQTAGENLAYGFNGAISVINAWMNSPEHRANMLNASFTNVGFGVAESANYLGKGPSIVVVAEYAEPLVVSGALGASTNTAEPTIQPVSRLQILTGNNASWLELLITGLSGAAIATFVIRHGIYLKRMFKKSEVFVLHHALFDTLIVFVATFGIVLTRTVGWIG